MSLSQPTLTNPSEHFFEWKGGAGTLSFYDKEKKENVIVPLPFTFIVLDQLHTITGYNKLDESGFWSNEVKGARDDLTVRTKKGVKYVGPYKNDQGIVQTPQGSKYTKSVYIAHQNKAGEWIMGNIKFPVGSSLSAWIDFSKAHAVDGGKITMTKGDEQESPVGKFYPPKFTWSKWTDEEYNAAVVLDKLLQQYLTAYLAAPKYDDNAEPISEDNYEDSLATPEQVAEFERLKEERLAQSSNHGKLNSSGSMKQDDMKKTLEATDYPEDLLPPPDNFNDEEFNPSEIPF